MSNGVTVLAQRPTTEQLEHIRTLSTVVYGNSGLAFVRHGHPESRQEASDLLKTLDSQRGRDDGGEERIVDTKTCTKCGEAKPLTEFYTRQGKCKPCFLLVQKEGKQKRTKKPAKPQAVKPEPVPPPVEADWREPWADPRVSQLEALRDVLGAPSLGAALKAARQIAGRS